MKRWFLLILLGILLTCYGISKILVQKEMQLVEAGKVIIVFVIGFTCIVLGLIFLNKRNMELFIEATDDDATEEYLKGAGLRPTQTYWYGDNSFMQTAFETANSGVNYYDLLFTWM